MPDKCLEKSLISLNYFIVLRMNDEKLLEMTDDKVEQTIVDLLAGLEN
jgi:hypothetical protein